MLRILKLLVVLGLVLAIPFASASALPDRQAPPTPAERLQQQADGKTEIVWDQTTGVPVFISADLPAPARAVAQAGSAGAIVLRCLRRSVSDAKSRGRAVARSH